MKCFSIKIIFVVFLFVIPAGAAANDCNECKRTAIMGKCENKALPANFWKEQKQFGECLQKELNLKEGEGIFVDPENTPEEWTSANSDCEHLLSHYDRKFEPWDAEMMAMGLQLDIAAILSCDRFRVYDFKYYGKIGNSKPPAYFFEAEYDCAREPVYNRDNEERYPSSLEIRLYYDGPQKELVKKWVATSPSHTLYGLERRMFINQGRAGYRPALMRQSVPITEILDAFEKVPASCRITPEKDLIKYNSEITIEISDFKDAGGRQSKEFNRVLVVVESGRITNGVRPEGMEKDNAAVFRVGNGTIKVDYLAPDTGIHDYELIKIYHCHDITKTSVLPLEKTSISNKVIASQKVMFEFPGVSAFLKAEKKTLRREDRQENRRSVHHHWDETQSAAIHFQLEEIPRMSRQVSSTTDKLAVTRYRYPIRPISLTEFFHTGKGTIDTDISGVQVSKSTYLSAEKVEIALERPGSVLNVDVDPDTGMIMKVYFPNVLIRYNALFQSTGTKTAGRNNYPIDRKTDEQKEWRISQDFGDDDTGNCYLATGGDGTTIVSGGSEKFKKGRYTQETFSSSWSFSMQTDKILKE